MIIPNIWKHKNVPNHQPDTHVYRFLFGTFNPIAKPSFSRSMVTMVTMVLMIGKLRIITHMGSEVGYWWLPNGDWLPSARQTKKTQIWRLAIALIAAEKQVVRAGHSWRSLPTCAHERQQRHSPTHPWRKTSLMQKMCHFGTVKKLSGQMIYIIWDGPLFIWKSKLQALQATNTVHFEC